MWATGGPRPADTRSTGGLAEAVSSVVKPGKQDVVVVIQSLDGRLKQPP